MSKLERATVPMCTECGAELIGFPQTQECGCGSWVNQPDYGYYAPDVAGVVAALRDITFAEVVDHPAGIIAELTVLADRLEGK